MSIQTQSLYPPPVPERALDYTDSILAGVIPNESELTAGVRVEPGRAYGFFTDTSLCIGCKACEVACKQWNLLPAEDLVLSGMSYDNTRRLSSTTWRHVAFIEKLRDGDGKRAVRLEPYQSHWLMMSDVCKHCERAGCLEACPTNSIQFGLVSDLQARARERVERLHALGARNAYLYGTPGAPGSTNGIAGLHCFFLLLDRPETYNLPVAPFLPARHVPTGILRGIITMSVLGVAAAAAFALRRERERGLSRFRRSEAL